jgi:hypothetical protein
MPFCGEGAVEEVRSRCRIVDLEMELENDEKTGRNGLETVLESRNYCVLGAQGKALVSRSRCVLAELEKGREIHSPVFEEQVLIQYYHERSWDSEKVPETMIDCPASAVPLV